MSPEYSVVEYRSSEFYGSRRCGGGESTIRVNEIKRRERERERERKKEWNVSAHDVNNDCIWRLIYAYLGNRIVSRRTVISGLGRGKYSGGSK